jgi:hypothetical protein
MRRFTPLDGRSAGHLGISSFALVYAAIMNVRLHELKRESNFPFALRQIELDLYRRFLCDITVPIALFAWAVNGN